MVNKDNQILLNKLVEISNGKCSSHSQEKLSIIILALNRMVKLYDKR